MHDPEQPPGHEPGLGGVVDQLVHADADEVHDHQLGHRSEAGDGGAHRGADDGRLGDRRVADPVGPEGGREPLGDLGDPTGRVGQVLAEEDHVGVGGQRLRQGGVEGLAQAEHDGAGVGTRRAVGAAGGRHRPTTRGSA
jgi:hypothetical protein